MSVVVRMMQMLATASVVVAGCGVEAVDGADGEVRQAIGGSGDDGDYNSLCAGCGANGLNQGRWNALFAEADRSALDAVHAWDRSLDGPVALCQPPIAASGCNLAPAWRAWIGDSAKHAAMMASLVKVIAPKHYPVSAPGLAVVQAPYQGEFGLAPAALGATWSYVDQEIITGGMLALLDEVHGVPVCLQTVRTPDNCATAGMAYQESFTFGNVFRMHYGGISGAVDAPDPVHNLRYGTVRSDSAAVMPWGSGCVTNNKWGVHTLAWYCVDGDRRTWSSPVVVLTPFLPSRWYYVHGTEPLAKPTGVPPVH